MSINFTWLHLTDFHQGMDEQSWLWPGVKLRFFEDLEKLHDKSGPWDLVLFTGDLTQRGSAEEFQKLTKVLDQLWEQFDKLGFSPKLLAVPGNHDLVRPKRITPPVKLLRQWNDDPELQTEFWDDKSPYHKVVTKAFQNYTDWLKNQPLKPDNLKYGILPGDFSVTIEKGDAKLGIVGLNSTFLQLTGEDYDGKLVLHARQFHQAGGGDGPDWAKQHHACLLLTHQPPSWLNAHSQQHLNGEIADHGRFAAHLCGHMHDTVFRTIAEGGAESKCIWQGRSLFGLEYFGKAEENTQRSHGYTIGKIDLDENQGTLKFWPRGETRLQGGQREIVPDYSIRLTDSQHTIPRKFNLLNPCRTRDNNDKNSQARQMNKKQHDIFVSYAHVDNEPLPGADKGWVTTLINGLKIFLGQKLGRADAYSLWMDYEVRGNTAVTPDIIEQIENAATFLLILSRGYLESEWCRLELSLFLAQVGENSGRVFVVERDEVERPENLSDLLGYKFWVKDDTGRTHTLAIPKPHPEEFEYYQKLDDLARDLSDQIKFLREAEKKKTIPIATVTPVLYEQTVFLALVSDDLEESRDEIKRYLEQQGVQILPKKHYSLFDNDFQQQLKQDLKQCDLFVQLLSEKMGHGLPQLQSECASTINLPILQWRDKRLDLSQTQNQDHKRLLMQSTVIVSTLVEFQEHIINDLKPEIPEKIKIDKTEGENLVFIHAAPDDVLLADQIQDFLNEHDIGNSLFPKISDYNKVEDRNHYIDQLYLECDAVIVVYDNTLKGWVDQQLLYCRRKRIERDQPFKVAVYKTLNKQPLSLSLPYVHILECPTPQTDTCLPEFIRILKT
jgi:predicted MPP superfamily phosphohydrolase